MHACMYVCMYVVRPLLYCRAASASVALACDDRAGSSSAPDIYGTALLPARKGHRLVAVCPAHICHRQQQPHQSMRHRSHAMRHRLSSAMRSLPGCPNAALSLGSANITARQRSRSSSDASSIALQPPANPPQPYMHHRAPTHAAQEREAPLRSAHLFTIWCLWCSCAPPPPASSHSLGSPYPPRGSSQWLLISLVWGTSMMYA
jgi:hypothetical protein